MSTGVEKKNDDIVAESPWLKTRVDSVETHLELHEYTTHGSIKHWQWAIGSRIWTANESLGGRSQIGSSDYVSDSLPAVRALTASSSSQLSHPRFLSTDF